VVATAGAIPPLVQLLGPGCHAQLIATADEPCEDEVSVADAGAIPLLLGSGSPDGVRECAARALMNLSATAEVRVTIADAGALPLLGQLLGWLSSNLSQNKSIKDSIPMDVQTQVIRELRS
jgi:hypothetical protein